MATSLHRPAPLLDRTAAAVDFDESMEEAAAALLAGRPLRVKDHFHTAVAILEQLAVQLPAPASTAPYATRQAHSRAFREAAMHLWVPVRGHRVDLDGAPDVGFLAELYPELQAFDLPAVQIQELVGAWKRYQAGVPLAVLGHRVHPFYGTYAPTRTEHLELFGTWLAAYDGPLGRAADVGTGCGVLALMLARAGFAEVVATDDNPNAVESVARELLRVSDQPPIRPVVGDLLDGVRGPLDLAVFNPPWTQGEADSLVDQALVFTPGLFPRFFDQALERLAPDGRVVLVFSNIMQLLQPELPHPIEEELARGRFVLEGKLRRRVRPTPAPDGSRRRTRERVEIWELRRA